MQSQIINQYLNLAFRFESELRAAIESGREIEKILSGFGSANTNSTAQPKEIGSFANYHNGVVSYSPSKINISGARTVGVINIYGVLSKFDSWCGVSYDAIARKIREYDQDPEIASMVLRVHTPGGSADGNYIFAEAVASAKKVVVVHTSYNYSAGYFGSCPADAIVLDNNAASGIGSIGSMYIHADYTKNLENDGVKVIMFRADGSEQKAIVNPYETLTEAAIQQIQDQVNDCRNEFVGYVNRFRRGKVKSEALTGAEFTRKNAIAVGIVDYLGDISFAIDLSLRLKKR